MTTNGNKALDDSDMADCDGGKVVTMIDVLQEQQEFEEDANAVLGASDDKNCTYTNGYIKRQAIYACLTCCFEAKDDSSKRAGVCLACSLTCHEHHELIELYTKRNFRCDCGNPKFNPHPCQYTPNKDDLNDENKYNQNFIGLYCVCHRPYPDPEIPEEDEMIQCIICEDWLHSSHLEATVPANDQYSEMICKSCMETNNFLHDYSKFAVNTENDDVEITVNGVDANIDNETVQDNVLQQEKVLNSSGDVPMTEGNKTDTLIQEGTEVVTSTLEEGIEKMENKGDKIQEDKEDTMDEDKGDTIEKDKGDKKIDNTEEPTPTIENKKDNVIEEGSVDSENKNLVPKIDETDPTKVATNVDVDNQIETEDDINMDTDNHESKSKMELSDSEKTSEITTENSNEYKSDEHEKGNISSDSVLNENNTVGSDITTENSNENKSDEHEKGNISSDSVLNENNTVDSHPPENIADVKVNSLELPETDTTKVDSIGEPKEASEVTDIQNSSQKETDNSDKTETFIDKSDAKDKVPDETMDTDTKVDQESSSLQLNENEETNKCTKNVENEPASIKNDIENNDNSKSENIANDNDSHKITNENKNDNNKSENITKDNDSHKITNENKRKLSTENTTDNMACKKVKIEGQNTCIRPRGVKKIYKGATFWPSDFRQKLCTCNECLLMYKALSVLYLIDSEDTVTAYETLGMEKDGTPASQYEKGLEALSSLDRVQQINALTEYNKMKDKLLDFLKSFKDRKEIVKEEDIKAFFAGMKPKREPDGVYFCR